MIFHEKEFIINPKILLYLTLFLGCLFAEPNLQYNQDIKIERILKTNTTSIGQKIGFTSAADPEVTILKVTIPPGKETGWHKHLFPVFAYVESGTLDVELENGKKVKFTKGSSFAEVTNVYHDGKNEGKEDLVLIAFYLGEKDKPLSIKK
jgi:quercetin dioxygenase-like cupin family protein